MKEYVLLEKESIETLCSLIRESHGVGNALDDENVATNTTFSSKHILELIDAMSAETQYVEVTQAEYDALTSEEIFNDTEYRCTDTGRIYKNGVIYGSDVKEVTIDEYRELEAAGKIEAGVNYMLVRRAENTSLFDASDIGYNDVNTEIGKNDVQSALEHTISLTKTMQNKLNLVGKTPMVFNENSNWSTIDLDTVEPTTYMVKNGWCFLNFNVTCDVVANDENSYVIDSLPKPYARINALFMSNTKDADACSLTLTSAGALLLRRGTAGAEYSFTFSYPVLE